MYGDVHSGDLWKPAVDKYCKGNDKYFPCALGSFYDKTDTDLFGILSMAPFIFVPLFFNQECRNRDLFWHVLEYIPNLSYGRGKSDLSSTQECLQDEHICLNAG